MLTFTTWRSSENKKRKISKTPRHVKQKLQQQKKWTKSTHCWPCCKRTSAIIQSLMYSPASYSDNTHTHACTHGHAPTHTRLQCVPSTALPDPLTQALTEKHVLLVWCKSEDRKKQRKGKLVYQEELVSVRQGKLKKKRANCMYFNSYHQKIAERKTSYNQTMSMSCRGKFFSTITACDGHKTVCLCSAWNPTEHFIHVNMPVYN